MKTADDVQRFVDSVTPAKRARDAAALVQLMRDVTGLEPELHGTIVGFGSYHYKYASGHEGDAPAAAFAPATAARPGDAHRRHTQASAILRRQEPCSSPSAPPGGAW